MTPQARVSNAPLAMNGDTNDCENDTNWLLTTPAPVATNPFNNVALPIIVERSDCGSPIDVDEDISHDSKAENRIDVEIPPRTRPKSKIGSHGTRMHKHAIVYVMQKTRHSFFRPLYEREYGDAVGNMTDRLTADQPKPLSKVLLIQRT
jgi:hypothetical protein